MSISPVRPPASWRRPRRWPHPRPRPRPPRTPPPWCQRRAFRGPSHWATGLPKADGGNRKATESSFTRYKVVASASFAHWMLDQEARALLARLSRGRALVLHPPMVVAAGVLPRAEIAIEQFLANGRKELRHRVRMFIGWLRAAGQSAPAEGGERRVVFFTCS